MQSVSFCKACSVDFTYLRHSAPRLSTSRMIHMQGYLALQGSHFCYTPRLEGNNDCVLIIAYRRPLLRLPNFASIWRFRLSSKTNAAYRSEAPPLVGSSVAPTDGKSFSVKFREIATESTESMSSDGTESTLNDGTGTSISSTSSAFERGLPVNLAAGVGLMAAVFLMAVLGYMAKPSGNSGGSVSDLVKRGQLRSDRGADSKPLAYDDPFNNPLVKMGSKNPVIRMCGKFFRLQPVTLTEEKVTSHQNRRIQAYKWKRPIVFLNEGDPVPEGLDPEEVRFIPSNHPFATTENDIDEESAQRNVYQTRGVPSRVRAEHDALRKKLNEAAHREPHSHHNSSDQAWNANLSPNGEHMRTSGKSTRYNEPAGVSEQQQGSGRTGWSWSPDNGHMNAASAGNGLSSPRLRTIDCSDEEQSLNRTQQKSSDDSG